MPRSIAGPVPSRPGRIVSFGIGTLGFNRHACGVLRPKNPSSMPWRMSRTVVVLPSASLTFVSGGRNV